MARRLLLLPILLGSIVVQVFAQKTLTVPAEYATIQSALDAALQGDTVLVDAGTYHENLVFPPMLNGVVLRGKEGRGKTVIRGSGGSSVLKMVSAAGQIDRSTVVEGFQFTGGVDSLGGGIHVVRASPTFRHVIVRDNVARDGGGIYARDSDLLIESAMIDGNRADRGGGVFLSKTAAAGQERPTIEWSAIDRNTAEAGGGLYVEHANHYTFRTDIAENTAVLGGGAYLEGTRDGAFWSSSIYMNAAEEGGGIYVTDAAGLTEVAYSSVFGNVAKRGGGMMVRSSFVRLNRATFWHNEATESDGGGLWHAEGPDQSVIWNSSFVGNIAKGNGSAVYVERENVRVENSVIVSNEAGGTGAVYVVDASAEVEGSNFAENGVAINGNAAGTAAAGRNWWGHPSGPYSPHWNPHGRGDSTGVAVEVTPFLDTPFAFTPQIPVLGLKVVSTTRTSITLQWKKSPSDQNAGYRLLWTTYARDPFYPYRTDVLTDTTYTITGLQPDATYYLVGVTVDAEGNQSRYSNRLTVDLRRPEITLRGNCDFDGVLALAVGKCPVKISNQGSAVLRVDSIRTASSVFTVSEQALRVDPRTTVSFDILFAPLATGTYADTLRIYSNVGNGMILMPLAGTSASPVFVLAEPVPFRDVLVGRSGTGHVLLVNDGVVPVSVTDVTTSLPEFQSQLTSGTVPGLGGGVLRLGVSFVPTRKETFVDTLRIHTSVNTSPLTVPLRGEVTTGVGLEDDVVPTAYALEQNFPNPFNSITSISYAVPEPSPVRLTVVNLAGQVVSVLVDEVKVPGRYTASVVMPTLPSGVYFYQMEAVDFRQTKKMVLFK